MKSEPIDSDCSFELDASIPPLGSIQNGQLYCISCLDACKKKDARPTKKSTVQYVQLSNGTVMPPTRNPSGSRSSLMSWSKQKILEENNRSHSHLNALARNSHYFSLSKSHVWYGCGRSGPGTIHFPISSSHHHHRWHSVASCVAPLDQHC